MDLQQTLDGFRKMLLTKNLEENAAKEERDCPQQAANSATSNICCDQAKALLKSNNKMISKYYWYCKEKMVVNINIHVNVKNANIIALCSGADKKHLCH